MQTGAMQLTDEQKRQRRRRNIALGLVLGGFIVLVYIVTLVKLGGSS
ncbi:MAG: hypothetical protein AAF563_21500 [Pseudomonadota bacterium]